MKFLKRVVILATIVCMGWFFAGCGEEGPPPGYVEKTPPDITAVGSETADVQPDSNVQLGPEGSSGEPVPPGDPVPPPPPGQ